MDANPLCRYYVLRCSLHPADHRTEEHESDCGIPDPQPGILHLRPCRMGSPWTAVKCKRNPRMRDHVCRDHPRTAAMIKNAPSLVKL